MAYSESLARRIRQALASLPGITEQQMFGGLAFMVHGKMCLTVGSGRIMCRIDPAMQDALITGGGCSAVVMRGRIYRGYIHISEDQLRTKKALGYWISLALEFNKTIL